MAEDRVLGSFRDPSGYLFRHDGQLYRRVEPRYQAHYDALLDSGLCQELQSAGMLVDHEDVTDSPVNDGTAYRIIRPAVIPYISYPYEWCFSQLKDAALLTLELQKRALSKGLTLKDASAYNIQFRGATPVMIDTLSFEMHKDGSPWIAYRQFCQHFLAPLALMAYCDVRLNQMLRVHIDGIPLEIASTLLPTRSRWRAGLMMHIHLHSRSIQQLSATPTSDSTSRAAGRRMGMTALLGLVDSLETLIRKLKYEPSGTEWADYYDQTNYTDDSFELKRSKIEDWIGQSGAANLWDLGANDGTFSRLGADRGLSTVAFDIDPAAVEKNYRNCRKHGNAHMLPLVMDLTNPSPGLGWAGTERDAWDHRGGADIALALALIHHLAIGNNVPLGEVARYFATLAGHLVIEFVPKEDSQVQRMLATREDIFTDYHREGFETAFSPHFVVREKFAIEGSERTLYWLKSRQAD